jgi:hypothetical protein
MAAVVTKVVLEFPEVEEEVTPKKLLKLVI